MGANEPEIASREYTGETKLLIIDDDPTTCQLLALQLEMEGYASTTLSDPEQVLDVIAEESPNLLLVDYHLGTHDGLDVLHTIRNHEAYRSLTIVVMSALDHQQECESAGADGFVLKPFSLQELVATIQKVLER
jgi:two-component system phosphate regulon response regulator PhoB